MYLCVFNKRCNIIKVVNLYVEFGVKYFVAFICSYFVSRCARKFGKRLFVW